MDTKSKRSLDVPSPDKITNSNNNSGKVYILIILGAVLRYCIIHSKYQRIIENHIEVSTPLNSWKRIKEGLYLQENYINPYDGDLVHETPLMLQFYKFFINLSQRGDFKYNIGIIFIVFDVWTVRLLHALAKRTMIELYKRQELQKKKLSKDAGDILISGFHLSRAPLLMVAAYVFNPYMIFNCVGLSTTVFHNFFLSVFLYCLITGNVVFSTLALALSISISLYTFVLISPLMLYNYFILKDKFKTVQSGVLIFSYSVLIFAANVYLDNTLSFTSNVYGFILSVPDLKPNIGLFWYFFIEMFDHFRSLFIYSFQINVTILYLLPLSLKYKREPFLLCFGLLSLISVFKSYPSVGDVGFSLSLLPCFVHLFPFWQQGFVIGVIFLITSALGPVVWHLWIYSHSANANFYFGVTLAFATAQIFLVSDTLFAFLKREHNLWYGKERKLDNKEAQLALD